MTVIDVKQSSQLASAFVSQLRAGVYDHRGHHFDTLYVWVRCMVSYLFHSAPVIYEQIYFATSGLFFFKNVWIVSMLELFEACMAACFENM
jgi:hypothetical protein